MGDDGIFRRPAVPQPVRIRRDINHLAPDDPIVVFYERAIKAMQTRALNDPRSWRYQAAIHDYPANISSTAARLGAGTTFDPFAVDTDVIPTDHTTFWRACQHNSWFFVPWHRMYLHFFEKIVASHVVALGGPTNWALPYWNYSASPAAALLPVPFRAAQLSNGQRNALFVAQRTPNANAGRPFLDLDQFGRPAPGISTNLESLRTTAFGQASAVNFGFGGPRFQHHDPLGDPGRVENVPHNMVHGALGGGSDPDWPRRPGSRPPGFMSLFSTAPLDPMFWLHHCNIDRLWEVWTQRQKQLGNLDRNPKLPGWQKVSFQFHDAAGQPVPMKVEQTLDTRVAPLSYEYEESTDPFRGAP